MSTFTAQTKNSASWSGQTKSAGSGVSDFLLKEDGGYLLLETGDKIILEQSSGGPITWTAQNKS